MGTKGKTPGSGRKKGTPNKSSGEVRARCRQLIEDPEYISYFKHRMMVGQLAPALHAAWGEQRLTALREAVERLDFATAAAKLGST